MNTDLRGAGDQEISYWFFLAGSTLAESSAIIAIN
jgi:hypothetical protein